MRSQFDIFRVAADFIAALPEELDDHILDPSDKGWGDQRTFDDHAVEVIATELQAVIASVISGLINAGSERDAINEDEQLHEELVRVLKEW